MKLSSSSCVPGEGIHKYRFFGLAAVDLFLTLAVAVVISRVVTHGYVWSVPIALALMAVGVGVHRALGVDTALNKKIFGSSAAL